MKPIDQEFTNKLEDKKFVANKNDRASNTDKIVKKLDELKPSEEQQKKQNSMQAFFDSMKGDQGIQGEKGETGEVGPQGDQGFQGPPGNPGVDGKDGIDGRDGIDGLTGIDGKDGVNGKNGKNGKDRSPDTGLEIVKKLTELKGEDRLDIEALKGLDKVESNFLNQAKSFAPRTLAGQADVNIPNPTNNQVLSYNKATGKWIAANAGSGSGIVQSIVAGTGISVNSADPANPIVTNTSPAPTFVDNELVSGSGTTFTLANTPIAGSVHVYGDRQRLYLTTDYTISGKIITTTLSYSAGDIACDYRS